MKKQTIHLIIVGMLLAILLLGCSSEKTIGPKDAKQRVLQIGYYGGICEAPIYIAHENGFFERNGLSVKLVKVTPATMKKDIAAGKLDAVTITQDNFKEIEQGLNIKLTAGFHTSYIEAVVPVASPINSIGDLKGKTIGVDNAGSSPMIYLGMELKKLGINPKTDINWRFYPASQLNRAMKKKEIDAFTAWAPFPQIAVQNGTGRVFFVNTNSECYADELCCYVGINGKVINDEPDIAKLLTKSFAEATEWVAAHPQEAAQISIDKNYTWGDAMLISTILAKYHWISSPLKAKQSYTNFLNGMKELQFLDASTDVEALVTHSFIDLNH